MQSVSNILSKKSSFYLIDDVLNAVAFSVEIRLWVILSDQLVEELGRAVQPFLRVAQNSFSVVVVATELNELKHIRVILFYAALK